MNRSGSDWILFVGASVVILSLTTDRTVTVGKDVKFCKNVYDAACTIHKFGRSIEGGKMDAKNREKNNAQNTRIINPAATRPSNFDRNFRRENLRHGERPGSKILWLDSVSNGGKGTRTGCVRFDRTLNFRFYFSFTKNNNIIRS